MAMPEAMSRISERALSRPSLQDLRGMHSRIMQLERDYAQVQAQTTALFALQADILRIAALRTADDAVAQLLRATYETLGFERGIYFNVDRESGIDARWQVDGSPDVMPGGDFPGVRADSLLLNVLRGGNGDEALAGDSAAPLADSRPPYILSPLTQGATTLGILYLDGFMRGRMPEAQPQLVRALTTAASIAIGNSASLTRAHDLANRDGLTGLLNRRALAERLPTELALCRDYGHSLTYVMIDVDDLKRINDGRGHGHGDDVLKRVAATLVRGSRIGDVVGRCGGDEFVVMLPGVHRELADVLVARLANELRAEDVRCSVGAAIYPSDAYDETGLTLAADRALYASKAAGKDRFTFA